MRSTITETLCLRTLLSSEAQNATWLVAVSHVPAYSIGNHGKNQTVIGNTECWRECGETIVLDNILPILEKAKVDAYLSGHDHDMQVRTRSVDPRFADVHMVASLLLNNDLPVNRESSAVIPVVRFSPVTEGLRKAAIRSFRSLVVRGVDKNQSARVRKGRNSEELRLVCVVEIGRDRSTCKLVLPV